MDGKQAYTNILNELAKLRDLCREDDKILLVHGGGKHITQALKDAGIESDFYEGQRVTDDKSMEVIEEILGQEINRKLGSELQERGCDVVYGDQILLMKCDPWQTKDGKKPLGPRVGKVIEVKHLVPADSLTGKIAVIAPIGYNSEAKELSYNINADWATAAVAASVDADYLFYLTDQDGILDKNKQIIPIIKSENIKDLIANGVITDGMLPKANSMKHALTNGVKHIIVTNGRENECLTGCFIPKGANPKGTVLRP